jgi:hypothetical protein
MNFLLRYMWLSYLVVVIKLFPVEPQRTSDPSKSSKEDFGIRYCFEREPSITIKSWFSAAMLPTGAPSFILIPFCITLSQSRTGDSDEGRGINSFHRLL